MNKPIIAVDIDDVLAHGTESLRLEVNKRLGIDIPANEYAVPGDYWGYYERVWEKHGVAEQIDWKELNAQMVIDQSHVPVFIEAISALQKLKERYELIVVTARDTAWEQATRTWLGQQFPEVFSEVYFAGRKDMDSRSKGELCAELGADWLIDDNVEHAQSALEQGLQVVLFGEYGWHHKVLAGMTRCKDWPAVLEYFDGR